MEHHVSSLLRMLPRRDVVRHQFQRRHSAERDPSMARGAAWALFWYWTLYGYGQLTMTRSNAF